MILRIDTSDNENIKLSLKNNDGKVFDFIEPAKRQQGERLLPALEKLLKKTKVKLKDIENIEVVNVGGSFTSLRIGVTTANALSYAIGANISGISGNILEKEGVKVVIPEYDREPEIGKH